MTIEQYSNSFFEIQVPGLHDKVFSSAACTGGEIAVHIVVFKKAEAAVMF
ncbi:hypothetical protein BACCIP111895_01336 [Neobacillus rhizosphaerae]|uniref:Uncharacterized protein n=1 Tax=Neobacillus rhizosphaerae TaxID=2880965 RepID=A0ABM9ENK5_9BACI|nr:hypothetical protein [Neobacillus rhizosphaerae]CAH2714182.1 hypothetical protein BACCIP111895_01336 [Neobacillus rhizosphaerae]